MSDKFYSADFGVDFTGATVTVAVLDSVGGVIKTLAAGSAKETPDNVGAFILKYSALGNECFLKYTAIKDTNTLILIDSLKPSRAFVFNFREDQTGKTLAIRYLDENGDIISEVSTGITEMGNGIYIATPTPPVGACWLRGVCEDIVTNLFSLTLFTKLSASANSWDRIEAIEDKIKQILEDADFGYIIKSVVIGEQALEYQIKMPMIWIFPNTSAIDENNAGQGGFWVLKYVIYGMVCGNEPAIGQRKAKTLALKASGELLNNRYLDGLCTDIIRTTWEPTPGKIENKESTYIAGIEIAVSFETKEI